MPRHSLKLLTLCSVLLPLAACGSNNTDTTPRWPSSHHRIGQNLPDGARIETLNGETTDNTSTQYTAYGTLRPSTRTVKERVEGIVQRGRLVVGVAQSLNRLGFRDPSTGDLAGFEIDLAREIARDIFGDAENGAEKIEFRYVDSLNREQALARGDVDIVIRTMTINPERQQAVEFSTPYLRVREQLLVQHNSGITGFEDLSQKTVCTAEDSTSASTVKRFTIGKLLLTRTWTDCLLAMQRHQTDAIFTDNAILSGLQAQDPSTEIVGNDWNNNYYAVAIAPPGVPRNTSGLVEQVNSTLERIRTDGTWQKLYDKWMSVYLGPATPTTLPVFYRDDASSQELLKIRQRYATEEAAGE